jgi:peptidoglycan/LPS O-acetylase OafA/YrhL
MLLMFFGGCVALGTAAGMSRWPNLLASLVYQHNLVFGELSRVSGVAWSLEIEVQFYIVAPLLSVVFSIRSAMTRRLILSAAMAALPLLRNTLSPSLGERFNSLPWHLEFFAAGFLLADLYLVDWREEPSRSLMWDLGSLAGWSLIIWAEPLPHSHFSVLMAPAVLITYISSFRGTLSSAVLRHPILTTIGGMCYSLYLLHYAVISLLGRLSQRVLLGSTFTSRFAVDMILLIPVVLAVGAIYFVVLERPCMNPSWPSSVCRRVRNGLLSSQMRYRNAAM